MEFRGLCMPRTRNSGASGSMRVRERSQDSMWDSWMHGRGLLLRMRAWQAYGAKILGSKQVLIPSRGLRPSLLWYVVSPGFTTIRFAAVPLGTMTTVSVKLYLRFPCDFIRAVGFGYRIMGWNTMELNTALLWLALMNRSTGYGLW